MATFSLSVNMERPNITPFLSHLGPDYKRAAMYIYTTLQALIADSRRLVSQAVTADSNKDLQSEDEKVQLGATKRLGWLAKWNKCKHPFAWDDGPTGTKTYEMLSKMLPVDDEGRNPLAASNKTQLTHSALAERLIKFGSSESESSIQAPLVKNGICPISLRLTVPMIYARMGENSAEAMTLWEAGLRELKIAFLPWHLDLPNARVTTHQSWVYLQHSPIPIELGEDDEAEEQASKASKEDPSAPWKVPSKISEMGTLWYKMVWPIEWDIKNASLAQDPNHQYVRDTYEWVGRNFDGDNLHHRLGMVLAIMVSRMLPNISHNKPTPEEIDSNLSGDELTMKIRQLQWVRPNHKGATEEAPFITMMSTAIIGILDKQSPLQKYLEKNKNAFGSAWTDKHCESGLDFIDCNYLTWMACRR